MGADRVLGARLVDGSKMSGMVFSRHFTAARDAMANLRPDIAAKMVETAIHNRATYSCAAVTMTRFDWPGMSDLPPVAASVAAR